jgi:hypothetical protein
MTLLAHSPAPWTLREADFPIGGTASERARYLVRYAILAPSTKNTQPWKFAIAGDRLELFRDLTRWLRISDPDPARTGGPVGRDPVSSSATTLSHRLCNTTTPPAHAAAPGRTGAGELDRSDRRRLTAAIHTLLEVWNNDCPFFVALALGDDGRRVLQESRGAYAHS